VPKRRDSLDTPQAFRDTRANIERSVCGVELVIDADGNIRITGTSLTVPARPADPA